MGKIKKCPHCNSTRGFKIMVWLGGHEEVEMTFYGREIKREREGTDTIEKYGECLNCGKSIPADKLPIHKV